MLYLENISFHFPSSNFHLKVEEIKVNNGDNLAIIGASGCGKTTMLNLISGILLPDSGRINCNDICVNELSSSARRIWRSVNVGFVFQDFRLFEYLNVLDNILLPLSIHKKGGKKNYFKERAEKLSEEMGISELLKKHPPKLSQGERQRCAIARALLLKPKIILGDEVTGNLDPKNKELILEQLLNYAEINEAVLVVVTHDHNLLSSFSHVYDFDSGIR